MMKAILLALAVILLAAASPVSDEGKPPLAPKGCTWVIVPIEEGAKQVIMIPFLVCEKPKEA